MTPGYSNTHSHNQSECFLLRIPPRFSLQTSLFSQVGVVDVSRTLWNNLVPTPPASGLQPKSHCTGFPASEGWDSSLERAVLGPGAVTEAPLPPARAQSACGQRSMVQPGLWLCGPVVTDPGVWTLPHLTLFLWDMWLLMGPSDSIQGRGEYGKARAHSGPLSPQAGRALCQPTVLGGSPVGVTDGSRQETVLESELWAEKRGFCRNAVGFSL